MYILDIDVIPSQEYSLMVRNQREGTLQVWHEQMGHQSKTHVKELLSVKGIKILASDKKEYCDGCIFGKCQCTNFQTKSN